MLHARLQVLHVLRRKSLLIQLLHSRADIIYERAAFAREIVNTRFSRAADVGVWRQKSLRLPGRHHHLYEPIAKQTGTSNGEFASFRKLNVIINLQRYIYTLALANHSRATSDLSDFGSREQNIGTF